MNQFFFSMRRKLINYILKRDSVLIKRGSVYGYRLQRNEFVFFLHERCYCCFQRDPPINYKLEKNMCGPASSVLPMNEIAIN